MEIKKALKGGIIEIIFQNNEYLNAFYWGNYIIAFSRIDNYVYVHLKGKEKPVLGSQYNNEKKHYPLLLPIENPISIIRYLIKSIETQNFEPLKRPDYKEIRLYEIDFNDKNQIDYKLTIDVPGEKLRELKKDPIGDLDIEDRIFKFFFNLLYGELLISQIVYDACKESDQEFKLLPDSLSESLTEDFYSAKNLSDYITTLNDAGNLIDNAIRLIHAFESPDDSPVDDKEISEKSEKIIKQTYNRPNTFITINDEVYKAVVNLKDKDFTNNIAKKTISGSVKRGESKKAYKTDLLVQSDNLPETFLSIPIDHQEKKDWPEGAENLLNAFINFVDYHIKIHPEAILDHGQCYIPVTINQLYKVMKNTKRNPAKKEKQKIIELAAFLNNQRIWVDNKEEYAARRVDTNTALEKWKSEDLIMGRTFRRILDIDPVEKGILPKNAGSTGKSSTLQDGFIITRISPLHVRAYMVGQVINTPIEWIEDLSFQGKKIGSSQKIKDIQKVIASRIKRAQYYKEKYEESNKSKKNHGSKKNPWNSKNYNTIVVDTLLEKCHINFKSSSTRYKYIGIIEKILGAFKERKLISSWETISKENRIHSYKFDV